MPPIIGHGVEGPIKILKHWFQPSKKTLSRFRWRDASGRPMKEPDPKVALERCDRVAERRARDTQQVGRLSEAPMLRDCHKGGQIRQCRFRHWSPLFTSPCGLERIITTKGSRYVVISQLRIMP